MLEDTAKCLIFAAKENSEIIEIRYPSREGPGSNIAPWWKRSIHASWTAGSYGIEGANPSGASKGWCNWGCAHPKQHARVLSWKSRASRGLFP